MAKCEDCSATVVWLRRSDGRWFPPVEPILDFADGEHFIADADGYAQPIPQIYRRHKCLTFDERMAKQREREEEKRRLIEADRARRAEEQRIQRELEEARLAAEEEERLRQEEERRALALARTQDRYTSSFSPQRLLPYGCLDCGAEGGEPCRSGYYGRASTTFWWTQSAHQARYFAEPLWGDDYEGPWPPKANSAGYRRMQNWLSNNFAIFDPDAYREREWFTDQELARLREWFVENGDLFDDIETKETHHDEGPYDPTDVL